MLIQALARDASSLVRDVPSMYETKEVHWVVDLAEDGRYLGCVRTTGDSGSSGGKRMMVPTLKRTSGIRPILLADTAEYTFGVGDDSGGTVQQKHSAYVELLQECAEETQLASVEAVLKYVVSVQKNPPKSEIQPREVVTFRVGGSYPMDEERVRAFWSKKAGSLGDSQERECVVCGEIASIPKMTPIHIKGIPGGQRAGTALVSANLEVFESFGLDRAHSCGVCHECAELSAKALNVLLEQDANHFTLGNVVFVFWSSQSSQFNPLAMLREPREEDVKALLRSYESGHKAVLGDEDLSLFNVAALTASGGRVVVRDFYGLSAGEAKRHLAEWFSLLDIADEWGRPGRPLRLGDLVKAASGDSEVTPRLPVQLARAALFRERPLPLWLSAMVVARCKAGVRTKGDRSQRERITRAQAALLKAVEVSRHEGREDYMSVLESSECSPAYLCGRLLAVLDGVQRAAIPNINSTVVDRFFSSACTAPASVFGKLISDSQAHLSKLRKEKPAVAVALEKRLEEVMCGLEGFPLTLSAREQGLFCLGFYHQRAQDRATRTERGNVKPHDSGEQVNERS